MAHTSKGILMQYTNKQNLPEPLFRALVNDDYEMVGDISATGIVKPYQIFQLEKRHGDEIEVDVSELLYAILGRGAHYILERASVRNALQEERVTATVNGWVVSGQTDLLYQQSIDDYKITSIWAVADGVKPEWEQQLNIYDWLYMMNGFDDIERLRIIAIFRDWSKRKARFDRNYPKRQVRVLNAIQWDRQQQSNFIHNRVKQHQFCETLADDQLPECSPSERWETPTVYKIMKPGAKRSTRNLNSFEEATSYASEKGIKKYTVIKSLGESIRCEDYCHARPFCHQYQKLREKRITSTIIGE